MFTGRLLCLQYSCALVWLLFTVSPSASMDLGDYWIARSKQVSADSKPPVRSLTLRAWVTKSSRNYIHRFLTGCLISGLVQHQLMTGFERSDSWMPFESYPLKLAQATKSLPKNGPHCCVLLFSGSKTRSIPIISRASAMSFCYLNTYVLLVTDSMLQRKRFDDCALHRCMILLTV